MSATVQRFGNYLGGEWVRLEDGELEASLNPSDTGDILGEFPLSGPEAVDRAVSAAGRALPAWSAAPPQARAALLHRVADRLEARLGEVTALVAREVGKPLRDAASEVSAGLERLRYVAGHGHAATGEVLPSAAGRTVMAVRVPLGVAAIITPWNYPIGMPLEKALTALVAGNTVVLKPAEQSPMTARRLAELFAEAGAPPGVFNVLFGDGGTGRCLCEHPGVALVSFTGSTDVGREIAATAGRRLKRVVLELGGKNALCVMSGVDLRFATEEAAYHAFGYAGQKCTAASRLYVHEALFGPFLDRLVSRAKRLLVGDATRAGTDVGPLISREQLDRVASSVAAARARGLEVRCGGRVLDEGDHARGFFFEPTVITGLSHDDPIATEELFGPVAAVFPVSGFDEAVAMVNRSAYGLSAGIYTNDLSESLRAGREIETGLVYVNGGPTGAEVHYPFGGMRHSGNGRREAGFPAALDAYTEWRTVVIDHAPAFRARFSGR